MKEFKHEFPKEIIEELKQIGTPRQLKSHEVLINNGEKVNKLYLILEGGMILLFIHPKTGKEKAINFFIPTFHPLATIADSFYYGNQSIYQLRTFTNTSVIEIDKADFDKYLEESEGGKFIYDFGLKSLLQKNTIRTLLTNLTSEEMLIYLKDHFPQILQNVPSKYVADFLGITPQWLSKLKHKI
ncbi:Crp/Fnr family transcriptional regulator [Aureivirga sp. CE67]|uniref:Crp/Fnr family transcriptional regulator n=1 Tax=Aureivirga sp. CE67 TaxID=1788983 RepID=UPI0018CA08FF|nr:cyclic nucleotide-binding domain-containing protein [Aureivirga sp. CE67]